MEKVNAINIIKQIFHVCPYIEGKSIKLMPPNSNKVLATGYQIQIQTGNNELLTKCLAAIAKNNDLSINEEESMIVIYKSA
jgi:hypothetical protein